MAEIKITPAELKSKGTTICDYSDQLDQFIKKIDWEINYVDGGWKGLAREAYFQVYNDLYQTLKQIPEMVSMLGKDIQTAGENFEQTDTGLSNNFKQDF